MCNLIKSSLLSDPDGQSFINSLNHFWSSRLSKYVESSSSLSSSGDSLACSFPMILSEKCYVKMLIMTIDNSVRNYISIKQICICISLVNQASILDISIQQTVARSYQASLDYNSPKHKIKSRNNHIHHHILSHIMFAKTEKFKLNYKNI